MIPSTYRAILIRRRAYPTLKGRRSTEWALLRRWLIWLFTDMWASDDDCAPHPSAAAQGVEEECKEKYKKDSTCSRDAIGQEDEKNHNQRGALQELCEINAPTTHPAKIRLHDVDRRL